jgi:hypothetical protein
MDSCLTCGDVWCMCGLEYCCSGLRHSCRCYNNDMPIDDKTTRGAVIGGPGSRVPFRPKQPTDEEIQRAAFQLIPSTGDADIDALLRDCVVVLDAKGQDYTVGQNDTDRLYNFREGARAAGISPTQVWWVYFWKHLTAVQRYVKEGKVDSEGIKGRILDCVNYLILLNKIVCESERGNI